jgi:hypothetical protein
LTVYYTASSLSQYFYTKHRLLIGIFGNTGLDGPLDETVIYFDRVVGGILAGLPLCPGGKNSMRRIAPGCRLAQQTQFGVGHIFGPAPDGFYLRVMCNFSTFFLFLLSTRNDYFYWGGSRPTPFPRIDDAFLG